MNEMFIFLKLLPGSYIANQFVNKLAFQWPMVHVVVCEYVAFVLIVVIHLYDITQSDNWKYEF